MSCTGLRLRKARWHALLAGLVCLSTSFLASAQSGASPAELALLNLANAARAEYRLPPLRWDPSLARAARRHAARVAVEPGELQHEYPGELDLIARASREGTHFASVSENLARGGPAAPNLHDLWMRTPVHRANILDGHMDIVGIGVVDVRGVLYAVEDFGRSVPEPQQEEVESRVVAAIRTAGMPAVRTTETARRSCERGGDAPTDARLVIQWDGSYPGQLPGALLAQIAGRSYTAAAVGACPSREPGRGFTTYRVAALLY